MVNDDDNDAIEPTSTSLLNPFDVLDRILINVEDINRRLTQMQKNLIEIQKAVDKTSRRDKP